jgi:DNA polymerase (family 10)
MTGGHARLGRSPLPPITAPTDNDPIGGARRRRTDGSTQMKNRTPAAVSDANINSEMARQFRKAALLLETQHADPYRVNAYVRGADALDGFTEAVSVVYRRDGLAGLIALPAIGRALGMAIVETVEDGHWPWLDRLEGTVDPEKVLATLPSIGAGLAARLHHELGVESLEELERAFYDGRVGRMGGFGDKRMHAIREALVSRLHRQRTVERDLVTQPHCHPSIELLLDIDEEYRREADLNHLPTIAPRRHNPTGRHWLPVIHTTRDGHHYTAMFSNTARAHALGRTDDWVVIFADTPDEDRWTVVTEAQGPEGSRRVVRGPAHHQAVS